MKELRKLINRFYDRVICHNEFSAIAFIVFVLALVILGISLLNTILGNA